MATLVLAHVILIILSLQAKYCDSFCSSNPPRPPYKLFGTKTLYDESRGVLPEGDALAPPGCKPIHVTMVLRHGSRYPGADAIEEFAQFERLKTKINSTGTAESCPEDLQKIQNWKQWYKAIWLKNLAPTGEKEMNGIAARYKKLYPDLFPNMQNATERYEFLSSTKLRAVQSGRAFMDGIFDDPLTNRPFLKLNNTLIRFYEDCARFDAEVAENDSVFTEVDKFIEGPEMSGVIDALARRLGIPRDEVDYDLTKLIYKTGCAEEEWATGDDSAWCLLFSKEDFQKFEYEKDMGDYLEHGYAYPINYEIACELKNYVMDSLKMAAEGFGKEEEPVLGRFLFGHSGTVLPLFTALKLLEDDGPYLADEFSKNLRRAFRTSLLAPGSANIAFVLYNCEGDDPGMKLQIHLNEEVISLPPGTNSVKNLWNLQDALSYYADEGCDRNKLCQLRVSEEVETYQSETLSTGAIVGITVGCVAGVALALLATKKFFFP